MEARMAKKMTVVRKIESRNDVIKVVCANYEASGVIVV